MSDIATAAEDPQQPNRLALLLAESTLWTAAEWQRVIDYAQTGGRPGGVAEIRYVAAARIAIDDAAANQSGSDVSQQLARAQAFAALAGVEQQRLGNLIAWKQLQTARQAAGTPGAPIGGDEITEQIERGLGLA